MKKLLININGGCEAIGIGRTKMYNLINDKVVETVFVGKRQLIVVKSLQRLAGEEVDG